MLKSLQLQDGVAPDPRPGALPVPLDPLGALRQTPLSLQARASALAMCNVRFAGSVWLRGFNLPVP